MDLLSPDPWGLGDRLWRVARVLSARRPSHQRQQDSQAACRVPQPETQAGPRDPCFTLTGACVD